MKAAVYHGPRDIRVEEVSTPKIADNEMLVRVRACGICGSDLHMYRLGMFDDALGKTIENGRIMGHELSGEVVAVGQERRSALETVLLAWACPLAGVAQYINAANPATLSPTTVRQHWV